jgi:hypothetical protein
MFGMVIKPGLEHFIKIFKCVIRPQIHKELINWVRIRKIGEPDPDPKNRGLGGLQTPPSRCKIRIHAGQICLTE